MKVYFFALSIAMLSLLVFLTSCTSKQVRDVASDPVAAEHIGYLRQAAENGVFFLIADSALRDVPTKQVGSCRKSGDPIWANKLFSVLEAISKDPRLYRKIHVIELVRGDSPKAEIDVDEINGLARLAVQYAKSKTFQKITPMTDVECARSSAEYLNKNLEVINFDWPTKEQVMATLTAAPEKKNVERFNVNKKFLLYLADRNSFLKVTQKQFYSVSSVGEFALQRILNKLDLEISANSEYTQIDYWLKEISAQSKQSNSVSFFGLKEDMSLPYGVRVDSAGKISRKINKHSDPSYLYISYRERNGAYEISRLQDLDLCLSNLSKIYKSRYSQNREVASSSLDLDEDSFLYPGYACTQTQR